MTTPIEDKLFLQRFSPHVRRIFQLLLLFCWGGFVLLGSIFAFQAYQTNKQALRQNQQLGRQTAEYLQKELPQSLDLSLTEQNLQSLYLLRESMFKIHVGNAGYLFLVDQQGYYLHHPNQELAFTHQNISDHETKPTLDALRQLLKNQESLQVQFKEGGQKVRLYLEPIPETHHYLGLVIFEKDLTELPYGRLFVVLLMTLGSLGVCFFSCLILKIHLLEYRHFKVFSWIFSMTMLFNIVFLWYMQIHYSNHDTSTQQMLTTHNEINRFKAVAQVKMASQNQPDTLFIPTGLFIKSLQLESSDTLRVTGYYWQKFFKSTLVPSEQRGVVFSDAIRSEYHQFYTQDFGAYQIEGQQFDVLLKQSMQHREYPLNAETMRIRLTAPNFSKHLILVPELDSYQPGNRIALDTRLEMEGWDLTDSFFAFNFYKSPTNFGIGTRTHFPEVPELSLNILVHRKVWGAFALHLVNLVLVLGLLFLVFIRTSFEFRHLYKPLDIFGPTLGLLFPLFLAHYRLRSDLILSLDKILYVDYLYFIAYAAITLVIIDFSLVSERAPAIFRLHRSTFQKSMFWPIILCLVYGITLLSF